MYGFLQQSLIKLVLTDEHGEVMLEAIRRELDVGDTAVGDFFKHFDDAFSMRFLEAVAKAMQLSSDECLRQAGHYAVETFIESGFLPIMRSLGKDFFTFLSNLDSMHDNFLGSFPKMKAPSFKPIRNADGTTTLHYRSTRKVLGPYTASVVQSAAKQLFDLDIRVEHAIHKGFNRADHDEFILHMPAEAYPEESLDDTAASCNSTINMAPDVVDKMFPWHFAFDQDLVVRSVGSSLAQRLNQDGLGCPLRDFVYIQRPLQCKMTFDDFKQRGNTPYLFAVKETVLKETSECVVNEAGADFNDNASLFSEASAATCPFSRRGSSGSIGSNGSISMRRAMAKVTKSVIQLHGEVIPLGDCIMFAGVPMLKTLEHMKAQGVSLHQLPVHSHGREMMLGTMMQTLSAKQANAAANELRMLENDRSAADRERALTGDLLHKILPPMIADALAKGETAPAETYPACTILFSDIVGFTNISGSVPPEEVMIMLNELFAKFDELTNIHGVYKVETVGDAYVVSAGAPEPASDHAERMCSFAIDMVRAATSVISPLDGEPLKIRCGLHSGTVMSGVVGDVRPRWCLFGDTVNVASRMESTGLPASIQVSYRVVRALPDPSMFNIITRGRIAVKGKGTMKTFLLLGLADDTEPPLWPIQSERTDKPVETWQEEAPERSESTDVLDILMASSGRGSPRGNRTATFKSSRLSEKALQIHNRRLSQSTGMNRNNSIADLKPIRWSSNKVLHEEQSGSSTGTQS